MNNKYLKLFEELARATAVSAEQVMDYNHKNGDEHGFETAKIMRDNFEELHDRIKDTGDKYTLNKNDAAQLSVGAMIMTVQLQDRIDALKKAVVGYQTDVIPKLKEVVEASTDEEAQKIIEEKFSIAEEK